MDDCKDIKYSNIMQKARETNIKRDMIDRKNGFVIPKDTKLDDYVRNVMCAIQCGISTNDWNCIAEAQAMLEDIELKLRKKNEEIEELNKVIRE